MKKIVLTIILLSGMLYLSAQCAHNTYYVKQGANGNGSSWENASGDLQAMINLAQTCDIIYVAEGIYYPYRRADNPSLVTNGDRNNSFVLKKNVSIYGGFAGWETEPAQRNLSVYTSILSGDLNGNNTIDSGDAYHVAIFAGDAEEACLDGFTITGGNADGMMGIMVNGQYIMPNQGGGIYLALSSPYLNNLIISYNYAMMGGGILAMQSSNPNITNSLFHNNTAMMGAAIINNNSSPVLTNVTISDNVASMQGDGVYNTNSSSPEIKNTIIYGNGTTGIFNDANCNPVYSYSLVQGITTSANGNMDGSIDPWFKDPDNDDYSLNICSPCLNKGNNAFIQSFNNDLKGGERIFNEIVDLGAYESPTYYRLYVNCNNTGDGLDGSTWNKAFASLTSALNFARENLCIEEIWVAQGTYQPASREYYTMVDNVGIYGGFIGNEDERDERDFENNITILKGNGSSVISNTFTEDNQLSNSAILDGFTIREGIGTASTPQDGGLCGGGIYNENASPFIENCIIEECSARWGGGIANINSNSKYKNIIIRNNRASQDGGGINNMHRSSPEFEYVTILNNYVASHSIGGNGGGVMNYESNPVFKNCIIKGNTATSGGGIFCHSFGFETKLINVEITGNYARYHGGAIATYNGVCYVYNGTISGNYSQTYGGGIANYCSRTTFTSSTWLYNTIVWGNNSAYNNYKNIYNANISKIYNECSLIEGCYNNGIWNNNMGTDNGNNIDGNPAFVNYAYATSASTTDGDFRLEGNSNAINKGCNDYSKAETDLDGKDRIIYNRIDIGAYEFSFDTRMMEFEDILFNNEISESSVNIYPNPVIIGTPISIEINDGNNFYMEIYDMLGKLIENRNVYENNVTVNLPNIPGQYIIKVFTDSGNKEIKRIMVN